jgi:hypothetical protein
MGELKLLNEAESLWHEVGKMIYGILESIRKKGETN